MDGFLLDEARIRRERERGIWPQRVATDYLDRWVAQKPEATALVSWRLEEERETRLSYRELAQRVALAAGALERAGVQRGDVVSFQLPSWWEFVALYLATVRLGAVANPLMPIFRQRELAFMLRQAAPRVFVAPARFRGFEHGALAHSLAAQLPGMRVLLAGGEGAHSLEAALAAPCADGVFARGARLAPNDVTQLLYTSGTTGEPKGVLNTSNTLLGAVISFAQRMQLGEADVIFMPSPLAHQLGFAYGLLLSQVLGVPLVLTDLWRPARAAQLIEAHGATFAFAATPFLADLTALERGAQRKLGKMRLFASSGAPIPPAVAQAARDRLEVAVAACWGMTECGSVTISPRPTAARRPNRTAARSPTARCASSMRKVPRRAPARSGRCRYAALRCSWAT